MSWQPRVFIYHNLITEVEAKHLIELSVPSVGGRHATAMRACNVSCTRHARRVEPCAVELRRDAAMRSFVHGTHVNVQVCLVLCEQSDQVLIRRHLHLLPADEAINSGGRRR